MQQNKRGPGSEETNPDNLQLQVIWISFFRARSSFILLHGFVSDIRVLLIFIYLFIYPSYLSILRGGIRLNHPDRRWGSGGSGLLFDVGEYVIVISPVISSAMILVHVYIYP